MAVVAGLGACAARAAALTGARRRRRVERFATRGLAVVVDTTMFATSTIMAFCEEARLQPTCSTCVRSHHIGMDGMGGKQVSWGV